jgi:radical SAM-linked protein
MNRYRLLFSKTGRAVYISHLDLMRTFQRAFVRAGIELRHTEGFNPHPYMSFALPLSVGMSSVCELLDFDLKGPLPSDLCARLNKAMPEGITALSAYASDRKFADIAWVAVSGTFVYDGGVPENAADRLLAFYDTDELVVSKKSKRGIVDFNIAPCIEALRFVSQTDTALTFEARLTAQNPSLNPEHLVSALRVYQPELVPDFASFIRLELFDSDLKVFR